MKPRRGTIPGAAWLAMAGSLWAIAELWPAGAHGRDARHVEIVPWTKMGFTRTLGVNRSELGLSGAKTSIVMKSIGDHSCVVGPLIALDVDDRYAFDIDEPVDLTLTYAPRLTTTPFAVAWDKNAGDGFGLSKDVAPEPGQTVRRVTMTLDRARFAGQGIQKTDLAVGARGGGVIGLCDVELTRSGRTRVAPASSRVRLEVKDAKSGRAVAARVGLYDATGRIPLPSERAATVHRFADEVRLLWLNRRTFWPSPNRQAFYVDGRYDASLPEGRYDLVVSRGPEYRVHRREVALHRGDNLISVSLERYADLPARGWYSGDSHIHLMRDQAADLDVWRQLAAEDVHVGHLLEMGNIAGTYFKQPVWGKAGRFERDGYVMVPGQEDPRTVMRGHTIHWNLERPVHFDSEAFFQYHEVFARTRSEGALTGYAHLGELFNGRRGLALDVPFGLVDFIEVLQGGRLNTEIWYSFLNLGYQIRPVAGADFPYFGPTLPGVERTYTHVNGRFSADVWLDGVRRGHVYVTNGPFLELTINGRTMGEELRVPRGTRLDIAAAAELNPDIDRLNRLELIVLGDVAAQEPATGQDRVRLSRTLTADRSMWIAVRAYGDRQEPQFTTVAHSAPIYVIVDDRPSWKADAVPQLVQHQRAQLQELLTRPIEPGGDLESWETGEILLKQWDAQRPWLKERIDEADRRYHQLLDRSRKTP